MDFVSLTFGGTPNGGFLDGRIGHAKLRVDSTMLEWDLSKDKISEGIDAEGFSHFCRINDIAQALRHLLIIDLPPAMRKEKLGKGKIERHENRTPIDGMCGQDILADEMDARRPPVLKCLRIRSETGRGNVVDQRIEPDISHIVGIEGERDAPSEAALGA